MSMSWISYQNTEEPGFFAKPYSATLILAAEKVTRQIFDVKCFVLFFFILRGKIYPFPVMLELNSVSNNE